MTESGDKSLNKRSQAVARRILYIEDDEQLCALFKTSLQLDGYKVSTATTGKKGIAAHRKKPFDLVVVDYLLPDMDGLEVAQKLMSRTPELKIVILTGKGSEKIAARALDMGILKYIIKGGEGIYTGRLPEIINGIFALASRKTDHPDLRQQQALAVSSDWIWEMNSDLRFSYFSDGLKKMTGIDAKKFLNRKRSELLSPEDLKKPQWKDHLDDLKHHREFRHFQYNLVCPDGKTRRVRISGTPVFDDNGTFQGYRGVCSDISDYLRSNAEVLNEILRLAVKPAPLDETLGSCLDILLSVNWLPILPKIAIFLVKDEPDVLHMVAERNTDVQIKIMCKQVKFGYCLCGRAALKKDILHVGCVDHRHDNTFDGMEPHGHYNVPIIFDKRVLGVFTMYLPDGHIQKESEMEFLTSVADVLARTIDLKNREEALNTARDQLEAKVAQRTADLEASKSHLTSILDLAPQAMILFDSKMRIKMFNKGAEKIFGYTAEEIIGAPLSRLLPEKFHKSHPVYVTRFAESGETRLDMNNRPVVEGLRRDKTVFPAIVSVSKIMLGDERHFSVALVDVTRQQQIEAEKRLAENRFNTIIDSSPTAVFLNDQNHRFLLANPTFALWSDTDTDDIVGMSVDDFFPEKQARRVKDNNRKIIETGEDMFFEAERTFVDGTTRTLLIHKSPILNDDGDVENISTIMTDLSGLKTAEKERSQLQQQFKSLIDNSPAAILMKGTDGKYLLSNKKWNSWFNPEEKDITGMTVYDIAPKDIADKTTKQDQDVIETGEPKTWEDTMTCADGRKVSTIYQKFPVYDEKGNIIAIGNINTDISRQKEVEAHLRDNQKMLRTALDNMAGGIFMLDKNLDILISSPKFHEYYQLPQGMVEPGQSFLNIIELRVGRGDFGNEFDIRKINDIIGKYKHSEPTTHTATTPNGNTLEVSLTPLPDGGVVGVFSDISERKKAEQRLQMAMHEVIKATQAKSEFMANMSHELRTPLNAILGFSDMISNQYLGPVGNEQYVTYAKDIENSGKHLLGLVNDILDIEQIETGHYELEKENFDVLEIGKEAVKLLQRRAEVDGVTVKMLISGDLKPLYADRKAILQIIVNLLTNAVKFTDAGGEITLTIAITETAHRFIIADTGIGIPENKIPGLTDPFSRHQPDPHVSQEGVGLGLAICDQLTGLHGGTLEIESKVGQGTTVTVTLPFKNQHP